MCYIGEDISDLEAIKVVGFGCCPADAAEPVKAAADYIAKAKGGEGVIREIVEYHAHPIDARQIIRL